MKLPATAEKEKVWKRTAGELERSDVIAYCMCPLLERELRESGNVTKRQKKMEKLEESKKRSSHDITY